MSWKKAEDLLADYDALSCMTVNTPAEHLIGFATPCTPPMLPEVGPTRPQANVLGAQRISLEGGTSGGVGRGAEIESLMSEFRSQNRIDNDRKTQIRKANPYDYSNTSIEKSFGATTEYSSTSTSSKLVMQEAPSVKTTPPTTQPRDNATPRQSKVRPVQNQSHSNVTNTNFSLESTKDFPYLS